MKKYYLPALGISAVLSLSGCVTSAEFATAEWGYVEPYYVSPGPNWLWQYDRGIGWGWYHPQFGWRHYEGHRRGVEPVRYIDRMSVPVEPAPPRPSRVFRAPPVPFDNATTPRGIINRMSVPVEPAPSQPTRVFRASPVPIDNAATPRGIVKPYSPKMRQPDIILPRGRDNRFMNRFDK